MKDQEKHEGLMLAASSRVIGARKICISPAKEKEFSFHTHAEACSFIHTSEKGESLRRANILLALYPPVRQWSGKLGVRVLSNPQKERGKNFKRKIFLAPPPERGRKKDLTQKKEPS